MTGYLQRIELLKLFVSSVVIWVIAMGYWPMTDIQQGLTLTMVIAGVNFLGTWWQDSVTTSIYHPKAADGEPLVRASGSMRSPAEKGSK